MKNHFKNLSLSLIVTATLASVTLSACAKKNASSEPSTDHSNTIQGADLTRLDAAAFDATLTCKNPAPITTPPAGATEIQVQSLQQNTGMSLKLVQEKTQAATALPNGKGSAFTTQIDILNDDLNGNPAFAANVPCQGMQANDALMVEDNPVVSFDAVTGSYTQQVLTKIRVTGNDAASVQSTQRLVTHKKSKNFYDLVTKISPLEKKYLAKGQTFTSKFYINADGNFEWRRQTLSPVQADGTRQILNEVYIYKLVLSAQDAVPPAKGTAPTVGTPVGTATPVTPAPTAPDADVNPDL